MAPRTTTATRASARNWGAGRPNSGRVREVSASCQQEGCQDKRPESQANEDELGGCEAPESQLDPEEVGPPQQSQDRQAGEASWLRRTGSSRHCSMGTV